MSLIPAPRTRFSSTSELAAHWGELVLGAAYGASPHLGRWIHQGSAEDAGGLFKEC